MDPILHRKRVINLPRVSPPVRVQRWRNNLHPYLACPDALKAMQLAMNILWNR